MADADPDMWELATAAPHRHVMKVIGSINCVVSLGDLDVGYDLVNLVYYTLICPEIVHHITPQAAFLVEQKDRLKRALLICLRWKFACMRHVWVIWMYRLVFIFGATTDHHARV